MPWSDFYWEMSVEAVKRKEKGESTYSTHSTVQQEGVGCGVWGRWKHKFPSPHLTHLFICLFPLPSLSLSLARSLARSVSRASLYNCSQCDETEIRWQWSKRFHFRHTLSARDSLTCCRKQRHTRDLYGIEQSSSEGTGRLLLFEPFQIMYLQNNFCKWMCVKSNFF